VRSTVLSLLAGIVSILAGCAGDPTLDDVAACAGPACATDVAGVAYANPIIPTVAGGLSDPGVMRARDGRYYLASTGGGAAGIYPVQVSDDLVHWTKLGPLFPAGQVPSWIEGHPWAPEIHDAGDRYLAYYTAKPVGVPVLALGVATSDAPTGPWLDRSALVDDGQPEILAHATIGTIDPNYFRDPVDGRAYLLWKNESNHAPPAGTPILIQALSPDGLSLVGFPRELMRNDLPWEGTLVEGPWMAYREGSYYLFYSANAYSDHRYAVGVARSAVPGGSMAEQLLVAWPLGRPRFEKHGDPILSSAEEDCWQAPGHGALVVGPDGEDYFLYHARERGTTGRVGMLDRVEWIDGWPRINGGKPSVGDCVGD
jgi:beta-xylosidase